MKTEAKKQNGIKVKSFSQYGIYFAFLILCVLFAIASTEPTLKSIPPVIITIVIPIAKIALKEIWRRMLIITGGIDLSVGSVLAIAAVVTASLIQSTSALLPVPVAVLIGLAIGAVCGACNGILITRGRLAPFITTMVMMTIARGGAQLYTKGRPISGFPDSFTF